MGNQTLFSKKNVLLLLVSVLLVIIGNEGFIRAHLGNLWGTIIVVLSILTVCVATFFIWKSNRAYSPKEIEQPKNTQQHSIIKNTPLLSGLDREPLWSKIVFLCGSICCILPLLLFMFGFISYDSSTTFSLLSLAILVLSLFYKNQLSKESNAFYNKSVLSWVEFFILLSSSAAISFFAFWFSAHIRKIDMSLILYFLFAFNGLFAFFFMRQRDATLEQELSEGHHLGPVRFLLGAFFAVMGGALALMLKALFCSIGYCAW